MARMGFTAYGVDDERALSEDTCLIARDQANDVGNESSNELSFLAITGGSTSPPNAVYLHRKYDESVQKGDIVIPSWTLNVLDVKNGSNVTVTTCRLIFLDLHSITLIFRGCRGYRHWDEVATSSNFAIPGTWSSDWPVGISRRTLVKFLPTLLHARTLIHMSLVVFDVLDMTMVCKDFRGFYEFFLFAYCRFEMRQWKRLSTFISYHLNIHISDSIIVFFLMIVLDFTTVSSEVAIN